MATWNKNNIAAATLDTNSINTANKSLYAGVLGTKPIVAIYGGTDSTILSNPVPNSSKIFFHTDNEYLRIKRVVSLTLNIPARDVKATSGGKKGSSGKVSYNGYADYYILDHTYGNPPPAFTIYVTNDVSNGSLAGQAISGSLPLQFINATTFRLGLVYMTDNYLVLRERYQVYDSQLPALTLKLQVYIFENINSVYSDDALRVLHSPVLFEGSSNSLTVPRVVDNTITFSSAVSSYTFNQVNIRRTAGTTGVHSLVSIQGNAITPVDPTTTTYTYNLPAQATSFSMGVRSTLNVVDYKYFQPAYAVEFVNTVTGKSVVDQISGIHTFGDPLETASLGLAGKFFSGAWRGTIANGNLGNEYPLTATNSSSSVTGVTGLPTADHRYGKNLWPYISFSNLGDNYGFIAIGYFRPPTTGVYTFYTNSDDSSGVWIGDIALNGAVRTAANALVNNGLGTGHGVAKASGSITLTGGTWYPIRIVYEEGGGGDAMEFTWSGPGIAENRSLTKYFKSPSVGGVVTGAYL